MHQLYPLEEQPTFFADEHTGICVRSRPRPRHIDFTPWPPLVPPLDPAKSLIPGGG